MAASRVGASTVPEKPSEQASADGQATAETVDAERVAAEAKAESDAKAAADAAAAKAESEKPPEKPKAPVFKVAPGGSIMCPRGHLYEGTVVTARDFVVNEKDVKLGQAELESFVARGAVVQS